MLDDDFIELLLDTLDDDFALELLLEEFFWMLELDDFDELLLSTLIDSSFASADADELSSHATIQAAAAIRIAPIALRFQDDRSIKFFTNTF